MAIGEAGGIAYAATLPGAGLGRPMPVPSDLRPPLAAAKADVPLI